MLRDSDVNKILSLRDCGWGTKRIAKELGISRHTVKKYLRLGKWVPPAERGSRKLLGLDAWLKSCFEKHKNNADVVRQELSREYGLDVSLRTVERAVQKWREETVIKAKATIRFETPPGKQLQIDFGSTKILIGAEQKKVYLFVATLGYSRRLFVTPLLNDNQGSWFKAIEATFSHFNGIPQEVLLDNAKTLVSSHNSVTREVIFNERFKAFASYWGFKPVACAPYRARTKGKDERMVGYVKKNAIAGYDFLHWDALERHLTKWNAEVADKRIHGTVNEEPIRRFLREEAAALKTVPQHPSFIQIKEVTRRVHTDACIDIDANHYSVPSHLVGKLVMAQVADSMVKIIYDGQEVACHALSEGSHSRIINIEHLRGIVGGTFNTKNSAETPTTRKHSDLLRPLSEYEAVAGGGW